MSEMLDFRAARDKVEQYIHGLLREVPYDVGEAIRHACTNPGKLTRPLTTLAVAHDYGVPIDTALPYAASIQFAHEASLVFDDEMDGSPIRRGQPSCFNKFGPETARLAGIYLLKLGQQLISTGCATDSQKRRISYLDSATGMSVVLGQWLDLNSDKIDDVDRFYLMKTGVLLGAAAEAGGILGRATEKDLRALRHGVAYVGAAYQAGDDLADALGTEEELGKPVHQDKGKKNAVNRLGIDGAKAKKKELDRRADEILSRLSKHLPSLERIIFEIREKHVKFVNS
ncbi:MAG: polyprenyl synthetase family protein [Nanoarchaeota archaeon]